MSREKEGAAKRAMFREWRTQVNNSRRVADANAVTLENSRGNSGLLECDPVNTVMIIVNSLHDRTESPGGHAK
ncbi:MAG TPA: hypothetical protein VF275_10695 [Gammaproteobacteria bacterium]